MVSEPSASTEELVERSLVSRWEKFCFGFLLPLLTMMFLLFIVMTMDSNSGAAEFAALGIFLVTLTIAPFLFVVMAIVAMRPANNRFQCIKRAMVAPGLVVLGAILFQFGLF